MTWHIGRPGPLATWIVIPEGDEIHATAAGWEVIKLIDATTHESHKRAVQDIIDNLPESGYAGATLLRRLLRGLGTGTEAA